MSDEKAIKSPVRVSLAESDLHIWVPERESTREEQLSDVKRALRDLNSVSNCMSRIMNELNEDVSKSKEDMLFFLSNIQRVIDHDILPVLECSADCEEERLGEPTV